ncbi:MAG: LytTR family DNA-binding domain-containing protein, partial [Bryobacteraceae bacterium]
GNGFDAVKQFAETKPDLFFLDVQMPKLDGFEVLELIDSNVAVIFVTAYDVYAMRAFEVHAVDYLLKPVAPERFEAALERVKQRLGKQMPRAADLRAAASAPGARLDRLVIKDGAKIHIVPLAKVDYFEAQDDYVGIHTEGKTFLKQQTLSKLEAMLDPERFIRVHRSYVINVEKIARLEPYSKDSRVAVLMDGTQLPVSQSGLARLSKVFSA